MVICLSSQRPVQDLNLAEGYTPPLSPKHKGKITEKEVNRMNITVKNEPTTPPC